MLSRGCPRALGHAVQTPTGDGAFLHCCLCKFSQAACAVPGDVEDLGPDLEISSTPEPARWGSHPLLHHVWAMSVWTRWGWWPLEVWGLLDQWCYLLLPETWQHLTPLGCDSPEDVCHPSDCSKEGPSVISFWGASLPGILNMAEQVFWFMFSQNQKRNLSKYEYIMVSTLSWPVDC